ncbi:hypothetical protein IIA16_03465, partial [bacterium]|nr:hypothetical protein [bacterium]
MKAHFSRAGLSLLWALGVYLVALQFAAGALPPSAVLGRVLVVVLAGSAAVLELLRPRAGGTLFLVGTALLLLPPWWIGDTTGSLAIALAWWAAWAWRRVGGQIDPRWWAGGMALAALASALAYRLGGSAGRLTLPLHWHNPSAVLFATAVPVALVLAVRSRGALRWVWAGGAAALLLAVALTQSRAGLAVALLPLPLLPWLLGGVKRAAGAWKLALGTLLAAMV